jgi:hypothetical protein
MSHDTLSTWLHLSIVDHPYLQVNVENLAQSPRNFGLDGYPALAQAKWHAWRARQNLEDRLPADFTEVLESVLVFTDGLFDTTGTSQAGIWSPADRIWS